MVLGDSQGQ